MFNIKKYYIWFLNTERSWLGRGFPTRKALNSINTSWRSKGTPPQPAFINFSWNKAKLSSADVSDIEKVAHKEEVPLFKKINGLITVAYDGDWWLESLLDKISETHEISVSLLHLHVHNQTFFYPNMPNIRAVTLSDILLTV